MKNYKFSKFNYDVKYSEDEYLIFNTLTLSLITLDKFHYSLLKDNSIDKFLESFNQEEISLLLENGIIVEAMTDEIKILKDRYWYNKYKDDTLHVSIMTTLGCNFGCPYCFETHRNVFLTPEIEDSIFAFIKSNMKDKSRLHVDWYGGEPLLNISSILRLSKRIKELSENNNFSFSSSITTNGYLLTEDIVKKLIELNLKSAQITLDGPKEVHDKMRPLCNNDGTYDKIINNIKKASKYISINLRVNVNKDTYQYVDKLFNDLIGIPNLCIAIKAIVPASYKKYEQEVLTAKDYAKIVVRKYFYAQKLGLKTAIDQLFQGSVYRYCIVDSDSQFIISPTGKVFKCGESYLDDEEGIIGEINNEGKIEIDEIKKVLWDKDPFSFNECIDCKILPLCLGGCQMKRNVKNIESCSPEYKYSLDELVKNYYEGINYGETES